MLRIEPFARAPECSIRPPGSKSLTNRALPLAALGAERPLTLTGWLDSEDTRVMIAALRALGHHVDEGEHLVVRRGQPGDAELFVGNSGTTMRFLTALCALSPIIVRLDGVARMRERPIEDLLEALRRVGVQAQGTNGYPPVTVRGGTWAGGDVSVRGELSSQFLSGLLLAAPFAPVATTFRVEGTLVSRPYIDMTVRMLGQFGLQVQQPDENVFVVPAPQRVTVPGDVYAIEPDASAASYFLAVAAITGGRVTVPGLGVDSLQGDVRFVDALEQMGCRVERSATALTVQGGGALRGIDIDMNAISDTVMTLAAVALFAEGETVIRNVEHIRHKETDRLAALATELRRVGAEVEERREGLTIRPRPLHGATIQTYDDHRMAMSLALVGLRVPGVVISDPGCVAKTYPNFFSDLNALR